MTKLKFDIQRFSAVALTAGETYLLGGVTYTALETSELQLDDSKITGLNFGRVRAGLTGVTNSPALNFDATNGALTFSVSGGNNALTLKSDNVANLFDGTLNITAGAISISRAAEGIQTISVASGTKIFATQNDLTLNLTANGDLNFQTWRDDSGVIYLQVADTIANFSASATQNGTTIFSGNLTFGGAVVLNPTTQELTLKKNTVLTVTQGKNILQVTALDDAGGKFNISTDGISFNPNSDDGALELNFVNQNRKVTVNMNGGATFRDGKISLDAGTTIDLAWNDGNKLKIKSSGSTVEFAIDETMGIHITSEDESISMDLTTDLGYTTKISAFKGSMWYNAGKVTFDANSKVTATGSFGGQPVAMTLETTDGDGYLNFSSGGITYGAGTGKIKVTMAAGSLESTIAVNKGSMLIGSNLFTIAEGSDIVTDLKTLIPSLNFTTADAGEYTINGQKITTTAANLAMTATDDQMIFSTSSDAVLYEGMSFAGSGKVTLKPAEVILGGGVVATGFGAENEFVLTEKGNVTVDAKIFELSEDVSSGLTVKGSEDGFTFSRTITEESEERSGYTNSPDIGKIFTEVFTAKGDNSYRISADLLGLEEIIGLSDGVTVDGSAIFDGKYCYHYFNLVTDSAGKFTISERTYTITGDDSVAIRARFYEDRAYAGYFESLSGSVSGDFSAGKFHINNSGEMQVFGDTEIEIAADDNNFEISGLDVNASLKIDSSGEYVVNSSTIEAAAGEVIVGTYNGYARLYDKNHQENILSDKLITATSSDNTLINTGENVTLRAKSGKDFIYNTGANVSINAAAGADLVYNEGEDTRILGGSGDDYIANMGERVYIDVGAGADRIYNFGSDARLLGGTGSDLIISEGANGYIDGGTGKDAIQNLGANSTILGGTGADSVANSGENVSINAGSGNDSILSSGAGVTIMAGAGADYIENYGSETSINAGAGNDYIVNYGKNILYQYAAGDGRDTISGFGANDTLQITKGAIQNTLLSGNDFVLKFSSGAITLKDMPMGTSFNLINADGTSEIMTVPKLVLGTSSADSLANDKADYKIDALGGGDTITNSGDNVTIIGGRGNDSIQNSGENILYQYASGDGHDTIFGFSASDSIQITKGAVKSQKVEGGDTIIKVGSGSITLKDFAGNANIVNANSGTLDLLYDNNFVTADFTLDEITEQKFEVQNIETPNYNLAQDDTILTYGDK